jgi:RIO kinase 1
MRIPESLSSLLDDGILQDVIRPLMSGKEAQVYLVVSEGEEKVAKVYKEAQNRTFKNRAEYTEGRKTRNSRDQRAMAKRSKHGRQQDEAAWRSTEVDMIYRLRDAGVRVPTPYHFIDGVLVMELVKGPENQPAPRLGDLAFTAAEAATLFAQLIKEVVRMLCAGVVHGDLSDFNVLMDAQGPVIIDFPQAVEAAGNQNARKLLLRDVANLQNFLNRFAPTQPALPYAQEMWALYESGDLTPTTELTGHYAPSNKAADTDAVLSSIDDAQFDERRRREARGLSTRGMGGARGAPAAQDALSARPSRGGTRGAPGGYSDPGGTRGAPGARSEQGGARGAPGARSEQSGALGAKGARTNQGSARQPVAGRPNQGGSHEPAAGRLEDAGSRHAPDVRGGQSHTRHASPDRNHHGRARQAPSNRPDHAKARQSQSQEDYGNARRTSADRPDHKNVRHPQPQDGYGNARYTSADRPDHGNVRHPQPQDGYGNARRTPADRPDHGNARHPQPHDGYGNARHMSADRSDHGNTRHTSADRSDTGNNWHPSADRPDRGNHRSNSDPQQPQGSRWGAQAPRQGDDPSSPPPARRRHRRP